MGTAKRGPVNVSAELSALQHNEKQNKALPKLPTKTTITRRPINHGPIASPFAGPKAQKVVYISRRTPIMSAVKRVKKFLREIEKRVMQSQGVNGVLDRAGSKSGRGTDEALHRKLEDVSEKLKRDAEEVLVKASGRAMEQALRIADWFRSKETEVLTNVQVRPGSVSVIDDIVEENEDRDIEDVDEKGDKEIEVQATPLEGGDTTMELLQNLGNNESEKAQNQAEQTQDQEAVPEKVDSQSKKRRRKRKRKEYDSDAVPEARIRWIKTVEVAISLRA